METVQRLCRSCEAPIDIRIGRKDRVFCDEQCKNHFHNTQQYQESQELKRINLILKKNRRILQRLFLRKDKDELPRDLILKAGFDFDYHTHIVTTKYRCNLFTFCYDYGYRERSDGIYTVIKAFEKKEV